MANESKKYDMVIFGATGYTGQHVVEEVARVAKQEKGLTWAIAGRSQDKLKTAIKTAEAITELDLSGTPTILADVNDEESLVAMAKQAKVVLNCVGPYRFYGESVVKACVENGASHVDISGEPQYLETMQLKYHDLAVKNNVYIIGACGMDSIPVDLGVVYLEDKFKGDLNSVEVYMKSESLGHHGALIHFGTWHSLIYGVYHWRELKSIREQMNIKPLPKPEVKLAKRSIIHYSDMAKSYCLPFMGSDRSVTMRSQRFLSEKYHKRPVQVATYMEWGSMLQCIMLIIYGAIFGTLCQFGFTRKLLEKYPGFFSFGVVSKEDLPRDANQLTNFTFTIVGEGWEEKLAEPTDKHKEAPNKKMIAKIEGKDPGYTFTAAMLVDSALTIIKEEDKLPGDGGVLSPGAAFAKTSFIDRLRKRATLTIVE